MPVPHEVVTEIVAAVEQARAGLGAMRLVCIDGPAGSGKTTLAAAIAPLLGASVIHMDDLYEGWTGLETGPERLTEWVLEPLASGVPGRYRRFDWGLGRYVERHSVPLGDFLVVEGVGAGSVLSAPFAPYLVWVEAPQDVRLARGIERDGAELEGEWRRWMVEEAEHHRANRTRERADAILDGDGRFVERRGGPAL
ncbi:uridine kinase family protein [Sanguibacter sp. A247]|uniref:uridine kinase family protein n=1 Tax=unclassified Sanguibacter TaxID=2645534 RepID=UPI003FD73119